MKDPLYRVVIVWWTVQFLVWIVCLFVYLLGAR
jgi:hypothetical protein